MYYNGYNQYQYGMHGCHIYPVPFMPVNPQYAHAYVPYQTYTMTLPIGEALMEGTIFPELLNLYNPHGDYWKEEK